MNDIHLVAQLLYNKGKNCTFVINHKILDGWIERGLKSIFDEDRSGRPNGITLQKWLKIDDIFIKCVKVWGCWDCWHLIERMQNIFKTRLEMKNLSARWVPRLLTIDNKLCQPKRKMFGDVTEWFFSSVHNCWRNMDLSQYSRNQRIVQTMGFRKRICAKETTNSYFERLNQSHFRGVTVFE